MSFGGRDGRRSFFVRVLILTTVSHSYCTLD